jgi:centriolar protein POC1
LLSACHDNNVYLWNLNKKTIRANKLKGHSAPITEVAFSPSSSMFATASMDHTIRLWSNSSIDGYPNHVIRSHNACVRSVDFSCDGRLIVSGSNDKTVKVFNVRFRRI